jgi:predicted metalloprotease with PDZ domain
MTPVVSRGVIWYLTNTSIPGMAHLGCRPVRSAVITNSHRIPELPWVYEGLTRYLNWVLAARSGIFTTEEAGDYVALLAAQQANRPGREWRSLQDTAVSAGILNEAADQWQSERRGSDYYDESLFIWLEVDTIIRRATKGERSLDNFCRVFFVARKNSRTIAPYTFKDVASALNGVVRYDWIAFFRKRLNSNPVRVASLVRESD